MAIDYDQLCRVYMKIDAALDEARTAWKAEEKQLKDQQGAIKAVLLDKLNTDNVNSTSTTAATFYRTVSVRPSAEDWDIFYRWIAENDAFEALQKRITVKFIEDYMNLHKDENGNSLLPPGVKVFREYEVRVTRGKRSATASRSESNGE